VGEGAGVGGAPGSPRVMASAQPVALQGAVVGTAGQARLLPVAEDRAGGAAGPPRHRGAGEGGLEGGVHASEAEGGLPVLLLLGEQADGSGLGGGGGGAGKGGGALRSAVGGGAGVGGAPGSPRVMESALPVALQGAVVG
jgi:hypothetical protein